MRLICFLLSILFSVSSTIAQKVNKMPLVKLPVFKKDTVSIRQFNAVGNGLTLNTKSIQAAIDQLASKGGGVVLVPSGIWQTGPIVLKSNINLHLSIGATLMFTKDFDQYPLVEGNWEGLPQMRNQSPISALNATNIAITGKGII
ncbi:MAG: glycoside hydrolase family 28 protein, partial [Chitinophagaceae bacterium]